MDRAAAPPDDDAPRDDRTPLESPVEDAALAENASGTVDVDKPRGRGAPAALQGRSGTLDSKESLGSGSEEDTRPVIGGAGAMGAEFRAEAGDTVDIEQQPQHGGAAEAGGSEDDTRPVIGGAGATGAEFRAEAGDTVDVEQQPQHGGAAGAGGSTDAEPAPTRGAGSLRSAPGAPPADERPVISGAADSDSAFRDLAGDTVDLSDAAAARGADAVASGDTVPTANRPWWASLSMSGDKAPVEEPPSMLKRPKPTRSARETAAEALETQDRPWWEKLSMSMDKSAASIDASAKKAPATEQSPAAEQPAVIKETPVDENGDPGLLKRPKPTPPVKEVAAEALGSKDRPWWSSLSMSMDKSTASIDVPAAAPKAPAAETEPAVIDKPVAEEVEEAPVAEEVPAAEAAVARQAPITDEESPVAEEEGAPQAMLKRPKPTAPVRQEAAEALGSQDRPWWAKLSMSMDKSAASVDEPAKKAPATEQPPVDEQPPVIQETPIDENGEAELLKRPKPTPPVKEVATAALGSQDRPWWSSLSMSGDKPAAASDVPAAASKAPLEEPAALEAKSNAAADSSATTDAAALPSLQSSTDAEADVVSEAPLAEAPQPQLPLADASVEEAADNVKRGNQGAPNFDAAGAVKSADLQSPPAKYFAQRPPTTTGSSLDDIERGAVRSGAARPHPRAERSGRTRERLPREVARSPSLPVVAVAAVFGALTDAVLPESVAAPITTEVAGSQGVVGSQGAQGRVLQAQFASAGAQKRQRNALGDVLVSAMVPFAPLFSSRSRSRSRSVEAPKVRSKADPLTALTSIERPLSEPGWDPLAGLGDIEVPRGHSPIARIAPPRRASSNWDPLAGLGDIEVPRGSSPIARIAPPRRAWNPVGELASKGPPKGDADWDPVVAARKALAAKGRRSQAAVAAARAQVPPPVVDNGIVLDRGDVKVVVGATERPAGEGAAVEDSPVPEPVVDSGIVLDRGDVKVVVGSTKPVSADRE